MPRETATRVERRRPARSTDTPQSGGLLHNKRTLWIVAALVVGFVVVRKLTGTSSATGAMVPVNSTVPVDTSFGGTGGAIGSSGGAGTIIASDGTPALGATDLATALSPFGAQLDNLQTQVDATTSVLTDALTIPAPTLVHGPYGPMAGSIGAIDSGDTAPPAPPAAPHTQPAATPTATARPVAVPAPTAPKPPVTNYHGVEGPQIGAFK